MKKVYPPTPAPGRREGPVFSGEDSPPPPRRKRRKVFLTGLCFVLSAAIFAGSLAEAAVRWDAMAPPLRIVFRLIGTGKLTAGEIIEAVRPEIASGALTYPLCVLLCALCGLWGLGTVLFRRRGFAAAVMYLCACALTLLSGGGTALRALPVIRCVLTAAAGCLFAVRAVLSRPAAIRDPVPERNASAPESARRYAARENAGSGGGRLFGAERKPVFRDEGERVPLFDHGTERNRRG